MTRKRWRQFIGIIVAVVVPSVAIAVLGWQVVVQQSMLDRDQAENRRKAIAIEFGTELRFEANRIKAQEITAIESAETYTDPSVVLDVWTEGNRLHLPWESDEPDPEPYRRAGKELTKLKEDMWVLQHRLKQPAQATDRLKDEIRKAHSPTEHAYLRSLRASLLKQWEGHEQDAFDEYVELLKLPSEIVDDSLKPQPVWQVFAAGVLIDNGARESEVLDRIHVALGSLKELARWNTELRSLLVRLRRSRNSAVASRAAEYLETLDRRLARLERLRSLPGLQALQNSFDGLGVTAERWAKFGEDELWLVGKGPQMSNGSLVVVLRADDIRRTVDEDRRLHGKEQPFRFAKNVETGYPLGDGLSGLSVILGAAGGEGNAGFGGPGGKQKLFYALSLALIFGLAFFGSRLMWRDTQRESRLAELRSQFVSSVSHELKTPLTGIRMLAETLQTPAAADPAVHAEYLETIVGETERLTRLLNNVLDFSKIERGQKSYHMELASLADVLQNVARTMRFPLAEQGFEFSIEIADGIPPVWIDRDAIEQAVLNLLSNAMKYSVNNRAIALRLKAEGDTALLQVVDHGIGIPPGERKRIFDKFYRVQMPESRSISGAGLGLALVGHIVEAHGGRVEVASVVGEGSTFSIRLPIQSAAGRVEEHTKAPVLDAAGRSAGGAS